MDAVAAVIPQVVMGVGLAACAGLRAFLPLLVVGAAGRAGMLPMSDAFQWLTSTPALVVFAVAVVSEILADKIPLVDSALDVVQTFVKPVAGTVLVASLVTDLSPLHATVLGIVTGGVAAGAVQTLKAKTRVVSTLSTAGIANPMLSIGEDAGSLVGSVLSILLWPLALAAAAAVVLLYVLVFHRRGAHA